VTQSIVAALIVITAESTEEPCSGRCCVFVAAWAARLLASYQAGLPTVACAPPAVTCQLVHNAMPIHLPIGPIVCKHDVIRKTEVHNVSQCHQRRTKQQPRATCTKKLLVFGCAVFKLCKRTDRRRSRQTTYNTLQP